MALGKRNRTHQGDMFVSTGHIRASSNVFYRALDKLLVSNGFEEFVEDLCRDCYAGNVGRPGLPPAVYFRVLLVGYMEGLGSERGMAWRCNDSLALREFLGFGLTENPPEHSTLSKTRKRLTEEVHLKFFGWVLKLIRKSGLLRGKTLGVDSTTLEANAAMRSIVRRDTGQGYTEFLEDLAKASEIATPTASDLAKLDKKRANKGSNKDWVHPGDPEARIAKMKDGRTHLAHKCEQAVDLETEAIVAVTIQTTDGGDTASLPVTLDAATKALAAEGLTPKEVVADKAYHSNAMMLELKERKMRSYISEPNRGRRSWKKNKAAQQPTYANRRRIRGNRGKGLMRQRGAKVERTFAHLLETGGLRRCHVRGQQEIFKRMLVQAAAHNLALMLRTYLGVGKPRSLQGRRSVQLALAA